MTQRDTRRILRIISEMAMLGYPYDQRGPAIDERLLVALGQIAGIASKSLDETEEKPMDCPR